jgi:hypothetical protein
MRTHAEEYHQGRDCNCPDKNDPPVIINGGPDKAQLRISIILLIFIIAITTAILVFANHIHLNS